MASMAKVFLFSFSDLGERRKAHSHFHCSRTYLRRSSPGTCDEQIPQFDEWHRWRRFSFFLFPVGAEAFFPTRDKACGCAGGRSGRVYAVLWFRKIPKARWRPFAALVTRSEPLRNEWKN